MSVTTFPLTFWFARKTPFTPRTWDRSTRRMVNACLAPCEGSVCLALFGPDHSPEPRLTVHPGGEWGSGHKEDDAQEMQSELWLGYGSV